MNAQDSINSIADKILSVDTLIQLSPFFLVFALAIALKSALRSRRRSRSNRGRGQSVPVEGADRSPGVHDPALQMDAISQVDFETQALLNTEEERNLLLLEAEAGALGAGFRVMAQTSLGEIVRPKTRGSDAEKRQRAFRAINSKRLDFTIFNRFGKLVLALEYQGTGHYHRTSFMRDAVKREVLRKANVTFLAVEADYKAEDVAASVRSVLQEHLAKTGIRPQPGDSPRARPVA